MSLQKLIWAELAVTDLDEALGFDVEVVGLTEVARDNGKVYLSCDIEDPHAQLILTEGGTGVRSFALGVDSEDELAQLESRLAAIDVATHRRTDAVPDQPTSLVCQLTTRHEVVLVPRPDRPLYRHPGFDAGSRRRGIGPADIDHITIAFDDEVDARAIAHVLSEGLGFAISDILVNADEEWQAVWTRVRNVHHDIGLIRCQPGASLHHLAWTVDNTMMVVDHDKLEWDEWRPGVRSRAWATAATGAKQIRIAEQILAPGNKAPLHWHYFEENITIIGGRGRFTVDGETVELGPGNTVIVPSMAVHGFDSIGDEPLHVIAAMGWPINEAYYVDDPYAVHRAGETLNAGQRRRLVPEAGK